jgi:hypothetical protein
MVSTLIFVTAFIDLKEDRTQEKSAETRCAHFRSLAATGIPIYLFMSRCYQEMYDRIVGAPSNVSIEYAELEDLDTYKDIARTNYELPANRTAHKDTANFMILMNAKTEFIHMAMEKCASESNHFAWIDFSIFHVFKEVEKTSAYLRALAIAPLKEKESFLVIPGCWFTQAEPSFQKISWRFCGGFFIGDRESLDAFYRSHRRLFKTIVNSYGLAWEVNVWAWLESAFQLSCTWVHADHDDSIVRVPLSVFA